MYTIGTRASSTRIGTRMAAILAPKLRPVLLEVSDDKALGLLVEEAAIT